MKESKSIKRREGRKRRRHLRAFDNTQKKKNKKKKFRRNDHKTLDREKFKDREPKRRQEEKSHGREFLVPPFARVVEGRYDGGEEHGAKGKQREGPPHDGRSGGRFET